MSIDDLADKMGKRFDQLDDKLDNLSLTVTKHTVTLISHDKAIDERKAEEKRIEDELKAEEKRIEDELKAEVKRVEDKHASRLAKLERWMWFSLGAGGAAGAGLARLLM